MTVSTVEWHADVIGQLERDWQRFAASAEAEQALRAWQRDEPALAGLCSLDAVLEAMAATRVVAQLQRQDAILAALVRQAQQEGPHAEPAGQTVLQLLLPGIKHLIRRVWSLEDEECQATAISSLWRWIRTGPCQRWSSRIAGRLLWRVRDDLYRAAAGQTSVSAVPVGDTTALDALAQQPETQRRHADEELTQLLVTAVRSGRLCREQAQLIATVRLAGTRPGEWAARCGARPNTISQRLHRAERSLADTLRQGGTP